MSYNAYPETDAAEAFDGQAFRDALDIAQTDGPANPEDRFDWDDLQAMPTGAEWALSARDQADQAAWNQLRDNYLDTAYADALESAGKFFANEAGTDSSEALEAIARQSGESALRGSEVVASSRSLDLLVAASFEGAEVRIDTPATQQLGAMAYAGAQR